MSIPKVGSAPSQQVSTSPKPVQKGPESIQKGPESVQKGSQTNANLEQWNDDVENLAQHLASDTSLKNPGQIREQAEGALSKLTELKGAPLQELIRKTLDRVEQIKLSSNDRWLHNPSQDPGDIFGRGPQLPTLGRPGNGFTSDVRAGTPDEPGNGFTSGVKAGTPDAGFSSSIGSPRRGGLISG